MKTETKTRQPVKNGRRKDLVYLKMPSPLGELMLVADETALTGMYFVGQKNMPPTYPHWQLAEQHPILKQAAAQLKDYFAGKRTEFDLPLRLTGTEFQEKVWHEIAQIPFGQTITYGELAKRAGSPSAIRAAGASTGRNPLAIIVPCHRVVGKDGSLTGFAGGLDCKKHLLRIEKINLI